jgi:tetratricopeptide (TPR) repeat protein
MEGFSVACEKPLLFVKNMQLNEALTYITQLDSFNPQPSASLTPWLGLIYRSHFNLADRFELSKDKQSHLLLGINFAMRLFDRVGDSSVLADARSACEVITKLPDLTIQIWSSAAAMKVASEDARGAVVAFEEALRLYPENADILASLARILFLMGRVEVALVVIEPGLKAKAPSEYLLRIWALILENEGQSEMAIQYLRERHSRRLLHADTALGCPRV